MAGTILSDNIQLNASKNLDNRYSVWDTTLDRPYNDLAEFDTLQPLLGRQEGLLFIVRSVTDITKSDLYTLDKNKAPYKVVPNIDVAAIYAEIYKKPQTITIAGIRALSGTLLYNYYYTTDLGQQGNWYYDSADTVSVDNTGTILVTADGKRIKRVIEAAYDVRWFGAKGDGVTNDTTSIQLALDITSSIGTTLYIPEGIWLVNSVYVKNNTIIKTDGFSTVFKQIAQTLADKRVIYIIGSNITIDDFAVRGNILTDISEQNHAVFINAISTVGSIDNINLGNIKGTDIRGDVLYIGAADGYTTTNINIGWVYGNNIYRNVCSICGGDKIAIDKITGDKVNLFTFDIEPEPYNSPVGTVIVGYIKGRLCNFTSSTPLKSIADVNVNKLYLSPTYQAISDVPYGGAFGDPNKDGMQLRNVVSVKINDFLAFGFNRSAIYVINGASEQSIKSLDIDKLRMYNNSITDTVYNAYVIAGNFIDHFSIGIADVQVSNGKLGFFQISTLKVGELICNLASVNDFLIRESSNVGIEKITVTGLGTLMREVTNGVVTNGNLTGQYLAINSNNISFINVNANVTIAAFNTTTCIPIASTINGVYYLFGLSKTAVVEIGTLDSKTAVANGLYIEKNVLYSQSASQTRAGLINTLAQSFAGVKSFMAAVVSSSSVAIGTIINNSLTASANNDVLVGLELNNSFNSGTFTGVKQYNVRAKGSSQFNSDGNGTVYFGQERSSKYGTGFEFRGSGAIYDSSSSSFGIRFGFDTNHLPIIQGYRESVGAVDTVLQPLGGNIGIGLGANNSPNARLELPAGVASPSGAPLKFNSGSLLTTPIAGAMEFVEDKLYFTQTTNTTRRQIVYVGVNVVSSASTLTLSEEGYYTFTGSTTIWTLPIISGNTGVKYVIINTGTASIILNTNGGANVIFSPTLVNTLAISPGEVITIYNNGTYWIKY